MKNLHTATKQSNKNKYGCKNCMFFLVTLLFCISICVLSTDKGLSIYASEIKEETEVETEEEATGSSNENGVTKKVTVSNSQFDIKLSYGIDGYAVYDGPIPITVNITSDSDFNGVVAAKMLSDSSSYTTYTTEYVQDVSLAANTENTVKLTVYSSGTSGLKLQIRDEDGNVLYEEKDTLALKTRGNSLAVGILSDDFNGLNYFDGIAATIGSYSGLTTILELDENTFPENVEALELIDYLIIDNYDTSKLSDRQYNALKRWVRNGGILICALGANYQNVLHAFDDDFITGSFDEISSKDISFIEGVDLYGDETSIEISAVDALDFEMDDATELVALSSDGTAYTKKIGNGAVTLLAYSLCMEPLAGCDYREEIAQSVISNAAVAGETEYLIGAYSYYYYYSVNQAIESFYSLNQSSIKYFLILFVVYILIVGPVIYIVLKKRKKRELIWIGIPVTALIFTIIVLAIGNQTKIKKPIVSSLSLAELDDSVISERIFTEVVCPEAKDYNVTISDDCYSVHGSSDDDYYYYYSTDEDYEPSITLSINNTPDGTELSYSNDEIFFTDNVSMDRVRENNIGTLDADIDVYTDGMEGTITNNTKYDFTSLLITEGKSYLIIDELKAGETYTITKDMFDAQYSNIWYFLDTYYADLGSNYYNDPEYLINEYVYENLGCGDSDGHVYIWGITDYFESITDSDVSEYGESVFYIDFYESYADYSGFYASNINDYMYSSEGDFSLDDNYIYDGDAIIRYQFPEDIVQFTNISKQSGETYDTYTGSEYAEVFAYNYSTGVFEQIFADDYILEGDDLEKYMKDNCMTLKFSGPYTVIPTISAEGEGND